MLFVGGTLMKYNPFRDLTGFELGLWLSSMAVVVLSAILSGGKDLLSAAASLIGVTALIFVAKGYVLGQILTIVFAVFYGVISFHFRYYGEMITYLCITAPIAAMAVVSWLRHPNEGTREVKTSRVSVGQLIFMCISSLAVTIVFYFVLRALGNANLLVSTISITTSFIACYLTFLRSPYYALGYAANDIVLIVLWVAAALSDLSCLPMVACFVMFLVNDIYGFISWRKMERRQSCN